MSFMLVVFFFFKQKTAYEIKECDWSSDVCSSDLELGHTYDLCDEYPCDPTDPVTGTTCENYDGSIWEDRKSVV